MSAFVTTTQNALVFRDGKPFGLDGALLGGHVPWPLPSTLSGMYRSKIGESLSRSGQDWFSRKDEAQRDMNIARLKEVRFRSLPVVRSSPTSEWEFLFPAPADAALYPANEGSLSLRRFSCEQTTTGEGTSGLPIDWLLPLPPSMEKPAASRPPFWRKEMFFRWLAETDPSSIELTTADLGVMAPINDRRIHVAIDAARLTPEDGALFDSPGLRLASKTRRGDHESVEELGVATFVDNLIDKADPSGGVYFGGERRTARNEPFAQPFPEPSAELRQAWNGQRFLRLVLISPGIFKSGWVPEWLDPDTGLGSSTWRFERNTHAQVRLRSAFVSRWVAVSGWDYDLRQAKAMRKMVPAGAVYVLEVKDPEKAPDIAAALWGQSLSDEPQDQRDGFGTVVVGCANRLCQVTSATSAS